MTEAAGTAAIPAVTADQAVAFRVAAHGLRDRRPGSTPLAEMAWLALPDYPRGAALRALAARRADVHAGDIGAAIADGTLVRALSLRGTTHVFAATDRPVYTTAVLPASTVASALEEALGSARPAVEASGTTAAEALALVTEGIVAVLAGGGRATKGTISEALHGQVPAPLEPWCARCRAHHVPEQLFRLAAIASGAQFVGEGAELVAGPRPDLAGHAAGRADLVRRFLRAYAPASVQGFADWSGVSPTEARSAVAALDDEVVELHLDGQPGRVLALAIDLERLRSPSAIEGLRLVPAGDPFLHQRDRATLVPDPALRRLLWRPAGAPGLVLVDGRPSGTWRHTQRGRRLSVVVEPWVGLTAGHRREVEGEAANLAACQGLDQTRVELTVAGP
jgi:Winged helix DNA-binding domain